MDARTFARLLAKKINQAGDACRAVARKSLGGWNIVDAGSVGEEVLYTRIQWVRSQQEYRVGKVDVFHAISRDYHKHYFYVGPSGCIE